MYVIVVKPAGHPFYYATGNGDKLSASLNHAGLWANIEDATAAADRIRDRQAVLPEYRFGQKPAVAAYPAPGWMTDGFGC